MGIVDDKLMSRFSSRGCKPTNKHYSFVCSSTIEEQVEIPILEITDKTPASKNLEITNFEDASFRSFTDRNNLLMFHITKLVIKNK